MGNLFGLAEFVLISLFFRQHLPKNTTSFFNVFIPLVSLLYTGHTLYKSVYILNGTDFGVLYIFYISYSFLGLYYMLKEQRVKQLETSAFFWSCVAFIVYFAGNFMLFLFHDYLLEKEWNTLVFLWIYLHGSLVILFRLLLTIPLTRKNP